MKNQLLILLVVQLYIVPCLAQDFNFHSNSPFGIQTIREDSTRVAQQIMFFDYDMDEDLDLLIVGFAYIDEADPFTWENIHYFIELQENTGDKRNPQFAERVNVFDNFPFPLGYFFPAAGDLDDDGKVDFIINALVNFFGGRTPIYASNNGSNEFDVTRLDSMDLQDFLPESFFVPELIDLDFDGDLDILISGFDPAFGEEDGADVPTYYYAKNTGSANQPEFLGWFNNPYGLMPNPFVELLIGGDIDNDGDMDLLGTSTIIPPDSMNHFYVHLNTPGFDGKPSFGPVLLSPFGLPSSFGEVQYAFPELVDIDGDGDLDLFVFLVTSDDQTLQYYENNLCIDETNELAINLCEGESITINGIIYSDAGEYVLNFEGSDGCDSTILLTIELLPTYTVSLTADICEGESFIIGTETFTDPGDYIVYVVAANGCDSIIFLSLAVNENYMTILDESICDGDVYSIGLEDFTQTGHYEVLLFSQAGCDSLIALDLTVIEVDNSVILNENILTANQSGASYQWIDCDSGENIPGASGQSYEVLVTGNYAVSITDGLGCVSVSECVLVVITGLAEVTLSKGITIYPNPTSGLTYILNDTPFAVSALTVTNLSGQAMGEFHLNDKNSVDISFLVKGVYFVKIKINGLEVIKKLIII